MIETVVMPRPGFNMNEGKPVSWCKNEGEAAPQPAASSAKPTAAAGDRSVKTKGSSGRDYEVVVIGAGPGGYVAAIKAAQMGKRTAIVEKDRPGGTCLNTGCIPTKALLRSAEALREVREAAVFGVTGLDLEKAALDLSAVQKRKRGLIDQLVGGVKGLLAGNGVTVLEGDATLTDAHTVAVSGQTVTADNVILATGSKVKELPIPVSAQMQVMTSTEALDLEDIPAAVVIVGGGVIGVEFAFFLSEVGAKVTIVEFLDRILPMVDGEITAQVTDMLQKKGIDIHTAARVTEVTADAVLFEKGGAAQQVRADAVLMAVGRMPSLDGIDCERLGIRTEKGSIVTDERLRTSVPNLYAVGDINGKAMLAHTASMEGIVAVENICGRDAVMDYDRIPSAIYIQPEIACVGLTEEQAKARYPELKIGRFPLAANGKAKVAGEPQGMVKVITEARYGELVGVHVYAIHATDMIAEAVVAMQLEATAEEIAASAHPHPTVSEVLQEAMHAACSKAIHFL